MNVLETNNAKRYFMETRAATHAIMDRIVNSLIIINKTVLIQQAGMYNSCLETTFYQFIDYR